MHFGAAEAYAHTGDLTGVAVCQADGTYKVSVKLTTAKVPAGNSGSSMWKLGTTSFQGTPTSAAGMDRGPVASVGNTTVTLGTLTFPGTTHGSPWVYAYTSWSPDGFARGSDGQVTGMDGSCKALLIDVTPNAPKVTVVCDPNNDLVTTTEQPAGLKLVSSGTWSGNKRSIVYEPTEGYQPKAGNGFVVNDKGQLVLELTDSATACPVTTIDQCVSTVGFPADAAVYADVHTAADSPVDNIVTSGPFAVNTQISVSVPTTNYKFTVIRVVAKDGTVLKTQQVTSTTACNTVIPNNPGPRTVVGTVQNGAANCTTHEVEQFRVDTVIPRIWDATAKAYVDDPDKTHWTTVRVDLPSRPMTADEVKACPVPDVDQCVSTVGFPADAAVYADVHTAADSPVDNIVTSGPFAVNTQISVSVPTTNYKFTVIRVVAKDGTVLKTQQVTSTTACNTVIPNNPGPRTVVGTVQNGAANCTTHEVEQFRVDTVIPRIWDATAKAYVDDPDKTHWTTVRVDLPSRPMTADEVKACPVDVPPNPGPKTVVGNWQKIEGSGDCVTTYSVWEQQGTWSVPQIWSNGAYVNDPNTAHWTLVKVDKRSRPMTVAELKACPTSSDSDRGIDATPGLEGAAHNWVAILTPSGIVLLVGLLAIWTTLVLRRRRQPMEEEI
jgi:hypothetical protein